MLFPSSESLCPVKDPSDNLLNIVESNGGSVLYNHTFFSLDTSSNSELTLVVKNKESNDKSVVKITNPRYNNNNNNSFSCYTNEVISNENIMTSTTSKVPDILMINKYYGLIPQKFTISSRKTANSTPSSAGSSSRRSTKSNTTSKPRAKSSTHHHPHQYRHERKSAEESKGFRSENDSPEPIKMILVARRSSISGCESPVENSGDPFGPVTKKMSVERYKKWKNCGGGKGRNMNTRSSSDIGQTLSLLDNGLPGGGFNSHAKNNNQASTAAAEFPTNRRVIKIDLNRVGSWDDENYRITTSSVESTRGENKEPRRVKVVNPPTTTTTTTPDFFMRESRNTSTASNNNTSSYSSLDYSFSSTCYNSRSSSQEKSSPIYGSSRLDNNGSDTSCFVHNDDNEYDSLAANDGGHEEQTTFMSSIIDTSAAVETNESSSQSMATVRDSTFNSLGTSLEMSSSVIKESVSGGAHGKEELLPEMCAVDENDDDNGPNNNKLLLNNGLIDSGENGIQVGLDKKLASMQRCGKLSSKTLSFDDKTLDTLGNGSSEGGVSSSRSDSSVKRRPTTASARFSSKTFSTPNAFNPPSKVIPWTQQKTAGGKALTLAERRAKFQRATSIHSSSSLSMETGEEEAVSEVESTSHHCVRPPSSAFRESRKPLHVTQPPEIPTMIAQINPNADEDIQIEIEKVALMLRKMHSMKHFSMSLDSGIEAEMARASSAPEEVTVSPPITKNGQSASTDSLAAFPETGIALNASGSESSVASTDSQSSEEDEQPNQPSKSNRAASASLTRTDICGNDSSKKPFKGKEKRIDSANLSKRGLNNNNSGASNHNSNKSNNNTKKMNISPSSSSSHPLNGYHTTIPTTTSSATSAACINNGSGSGAARRPPLRKAVSISCEQELLKTGGDHKGNEVNFNANDNGKSPRPKTATVGSSHSQRSNVSGTRSIHNNYQYRQNSISSSGESHQTTTTAAGASAGNGSQGSRNRKILIKKALMEINQSSVNMRKKWGTLGRPRTAPSSEKSNNVAHQSGLIASQQHPRKPLKASPFPISANGRMGLSSSGKSVSTGGGKPNGEVMEIQKTLEKGGPAGQIQRSSSDAPADDSGDKTFEQQQNGEKSNKGKTAFRQCFSLDESALLGFSIKSVNGGRIPIFEKLASADSTESCPTSIMDDEISFLSSKKREQCLKVYEKMMKTGCTIKLETVFRGMLTPSEYRAFVRAAEKASQEELDEDEETIDQITGESLPEQVNGSLGQETTNE